MSIETDLARGLADDLHAAGIGIVDSPPVPGDTVIRYLDLSEDDPDRGIAVRVQILEDHERLPNGDRNVQFYFRGTTDPSVVDDIAQAVFDRLEMRTLLVCGSVLVAYIKRTSSTAGIPVRDQLGRYERSDNYFAHITVPPTASRPGN